MVPLFRHRKANANRTAQRQQPWVPQCIRSKSRTTPHVAVECCARTIVGKTTNYQCLLHRRRGQTSDPDGEHYYSQSELACGPIGNECRHFRLRCAATPVPTATIPWPSSACLLFVVTFP